MLIQISKLISVSLTADTQWMAMILKRGAVGYLTIDQWGLCNDIQGILHGGEIHY